MWLTSLLVRSAIASAIAPIGRNFGLFKDTVMKIRRSAYHGSETPVVTSAGSAATDRIVAVHMPVSLVPQPAVNWEAGDAADSWEFFTQLLRARLERPGEHSATNNRKEISPPHVLPRSSIGDVAKIAVLRARFIDYSITSSAIASNGGGTFSPTANAVLRLIANSNLVGCSTGRSAGCMPLSILSVYIAARRKRLG